MRMLVPPCQTGAAQVTATAGLQACPCKLSAGPGATACMQTHAVNKGTLAHLPLGNSEVMRAVCGSVMLMLAIGEAGLLRLCSTLSSRVWRSTSSGSTLPASDVDTCMSCTALSICTGRETPIPKSLKLWFLLKPAKTPAKTLLLATVFS